MDIKNSPALKALLQIPPDYASVGIITPEEATQIGYEYADTCFFDYDYSRDELPNDYYEWCWKEPIPMPGYHSTYLYEVMEFLLNKGLDPNYTVEGDYSLMENVAYTVNGYVAADTLRLLIEHGGDPELVVDGGTVFSNIDKDVFYDTDGQHDRRCYDSLVHAWMVLQGFIDNIKDGYPAVFNEFLPTARETHLFELSNLKEHRNYSFCLTCDEHGERLHIFDKRTYWEVARF